MPALQQQVFQQLHIFMVSVNLTLTITCIVVNPLIPELFLNISDNFILHKRESHPFKWHDNICLFKSIGVALIFGRFSRGRPMNTF